MSKASQIIILCEDKAHDVFVKRFLKSGWGIKGRLVRTVDYPNGDGSGKKHVIDKIADEALAMRRRAAETILLVIHDADEDSVDDVKAKLDAQLDPPRSDNDNIAYIIPKWHIETWIAYLDGESIGPAEENERKTYKNKYEKIAKQKGAHPFIDSLSDFCKNRQPLDIPPPSLVAACTEFERIRDVLT